MIELEDAQQQIRASVTPLQPELSPLPSAAGRVLNSDALARVDLPPFDNSAMDGYAVRCADLSAAQAEAVVRLQQIGRVEAGETFPGHVSAGQCVRVFTGSALPPGTDAVVMQEDVVVAPSESGVVSVPGNSVTPWENIRFRGEDFKQGEVLVPRGTRLGAGHVGLLAANGYLEVPVTRRPVLGLVATGNELREPGDALQPGQIYESNRLSLAALATGAGAIPRTYPLVPDDLATTQKALRTAFSECDAVVTSGGVSVGELDFVKAALEGLQGQLSFWRVAMKPGKPFVFGRHENKLLFGLPGNPVSAMVTFLLLVRPALLAFQGATHCDIRQRQGTLAEPLSNRGDRRHFVRVGRDANGLVRPAGAQASHLLRSFAQADGLVDVAPNTILPAGAIVPVLEWD